MKPANHLAAARRLAAAVAVACTAAHAQIDIATGAQSQLASSDAQAFAPPVLRAWGWSMASALGSNTVFGTGDPPCSSIVCPPGPTVGGGHAGAVGRADATRMNVGVRSWAESSGPLSVGTVDVEVKDALTTPSFVTLSFAIHLDLAVIATAEPGTEARYSFGITVGDGDFRSGVFGFQAERVYTSANQFETTALVYLNDGATVIDLGTIPGSYDITLPVAFAPGSTTIRVSAGATGEASQPDGFADVDVYDSAWLGIAGNYASVNGYAYPGFALVPEPHAGLLLALGVCVVAGRVAARARQAALP